MILRVDVENVAAMVELEEHENWSIELLETILRMCGQEVVRTALALGSAISEEVEVQRDVDG